MPTAAADRTAGNSGSRPNNRVRFRPASSAQAGKAFILLDKLDRSR